MELFDAIATRTMTRRFSPRPVADNDLDRVLDAARRAPSAGATRGVEFLVFAGESNLARFWALASQPSWRTSGRPSTSVLQAPVVAMPLADPDAYVERYSLSDKARSSLHGLSAASWPVPYWIVDAAFSVMLMLLAATDVGLGALFFRLHAPERDVLTGLGLSPRRVTIGAIALGYPADDDTFIASAEPLAPAVDGR